MEEKLTLKQARLRVASLEKELSRLNPKISMYADRCAKHMANLAARGVCIDAEELDENPYNVGRKHNLDTMSKEFDILYKAMDAHQYMVDNQKKFDNTKKSLDKYSAILTKLERENDDIENGRAIVLSALRESFEEYKETYVKQAIAAHTRLFERAQEKKPILNAELKQLREELDTYRVGDCRKRGYVLSKIKDIKAQLSHRIYIFKNLDEYLADIKKDIDAYWVSSLNRLADVLYKKNAVSGLSVKMRSCTSRGFSAIIQEGSTREFDARMIWAAEDSTIVTPHFRYIVTERKL